MLAQFVDSFLTYNGTDPTALARQQTLNNKVAVSEFYALDSQNNSFLIPTAPSGPAFQAVQNAIANVNGTQASVLAAEALITEAVQLKSLAPLLNLAGQTYTVTPGGSIVGAGLNNDTFNAPLVGGEPTLTSTTSLTDTGTGNVLNAAFSGTPSPQQPGSMNIQGIQTWNVSQDLNNSTVVITGDAAGGPAIISGLTNLVFSDDETNGSLIIGDNSSPVYEPNGANGFSITVNSAVGTGHNGVDVDIAANAFTGKDTINVTANVVGGFATQNGSYVVPAEIVVAPNDGDNYNPNWVGYLNNAFGISAGASAGSVGALNNITPPPSGAVGFQNWVISSVGAKAVATLNILALGNEGSWNAQTLTLSDDGSNTMLFATQQSDSLSTDWSNLQTINLTATSGFVTITGAEVDAAEGSGSFAALGQSSAFGGGGLLTSDTSALTSITGGTGNSFYDLSSLTLKAAAAGAWDGGHSTAGNSEVAFNNSVVASVSGANPLGVPVTLTHISVLDDTGNASGDQGGTINMADFGGLLPTNVPYALLAENLAQNGGVGVGVPYGLPYTQAQLLYATPAAEAALLPPTVSTLQATEMQNGVVPVGFQVLQLLTSDGSTQTTLTSDLTIANGFTQFAINMQDMADYNHNITIDTTVPSTFVNFSNTLDVFVSDDGANVGNSGVTTFFSVTGLIVPVSLSGLGATVSQTNTLFIGHTVTTGTEINVPTFTVDNYTTTNFVMPVESVAVSATTTSTSTTQTVALTGAAQLAEDALLGLAAGSPIFDTITSTTVTTTINTIRDFVVLGSTGFIDQPVVTVNDPTLNFYDNHADNGGSPPGLPSDLVLGHTNFTANLTYADIGYTTVVLDATGFLPPGYTLTINDFGAGTFEIGATDATNLNAQLTSGLYMDVAGTNFATGIIVNGSTADQNLLQGTSGVVTIDATGSAFSHGVTTGIQGVGTFDGVGNTGIGNAVTTGGVGPTLEDIAGPSGGVGNDTLTGGVGANGQTYIEIGGLAGVGVSYFGNSGDNYFPEGGNDVVNITHASANPAYSTVWVGLYDVSSTGVDGPNGTGSGVHTLYGQAITDISASGFETYVNAYGSSTATVHGFVAGNSVSTGDILNFDVNDWATGALAAGGTDYGLVNTGGGLQPFGGSLAALGTHNADAVLFDVGFAGEWTTTGAFGGTGAGLQTFASLIVDTINPYANAAGLVHALTQATQGDIYIGNAGTAFIGANSTDHVLIAYETASGNTDIADVTIHNNTGAFQVLHTSNANLTVTAVDLASLVGVNVGDLSSHNLHFV